MGRLYSEVGTAPRGRATSQRCGKATLASGGKRLVVKNCAHTGRLPTLLELFPNAKFIHIHRNPYDVFLSTLHMHRTVLLRSQLQKIEPDRVEAHVLGFYDLLMRRFLAERSLIPAGIMTAIGSAFMIAAASTSMFVPAILIFAGIWLVASQFFGRKAPPEEVEPEKVVAEPHEFKVPDPSEDPAA